jgi:hypothetical protein
LAVTGQTTLIFFQQFSDSGRPVFNSVLAHYLYFNNVYLSERPKSVNWAGLVHFSCEVLWLGNHGESSTVANGLWVAFGDLTDLLLEPLQAFLELSCQFAAVLHECLEGMRRSSEPS